MFFNGNFRNDLCIEGDPRRAGPPFCLLSFSVSPHLRLPHPLRLSKGGRLDRYPWASPTGVKSDIVVGSKPCHSLESALPCPHGRRERIGKSIQPQEPPVGRGWLFNCHLVFHSRDGVDGLSHPFVLSLRRISLVKATHAVCHPSDFNRRSATSP